MAYIRTSSEMNFFCCLCGPGIIECFGGVIGGTRSGNKP